jgi:beta-glucosidase-like glycosyl hydrolase
MTLEEKVNITYGWTSPTNACVGNTGSVPRLGWPGMCLQDAGNGVRIVDFANAYPAGLHVGASWDSALAYQRGQMMGQEFRTKGGSFENHFISIKYASLTAVVQPMLPWGRSPRRLVGWLLEGEIGRDLQ